jgi:hypothetical protein
MAPLQSHPFQKQFESPWTNILNCRTTSYDLLAAGNAGDGYRVKATAAGPASAHDEYVATLDPGKQSGTQCDTSFLFCFSNMTYQMTSNLGKGHFLEISTVFGLLSPFFFLSSCHFALLTQNSYSMTL